ncbi:hypothetical protein BASA81_017913 [Batrachochytrium salamandrivorans]|nr:hypothetical protein BASA81_017913 [Batrachochytrium salamandrivorans]
MSVGVSSQEYNHEPPYSLLHALSASTTKATLPATTPTALEARTAYVGSSSPLFIPQNSTSRARTRSSFCSDSQLPQFGNDETLQQLQLRPQSLYVYFNTPGWSISLFLKALGWQNIAGVVTQLIFPCAAPWYNDKFGFAPANYTMSGDPAGLVNIDTLLGTHMYTQLFNSSPLVFGAMPSLHSAFACLIMLFVMQTSRRSGYIAIAIFKPSLETPVALSTSNTFSKGLLGGYFSVPAASTLSDSSTPFKTYYPTTKEYAQLPEMATHPHETTAFAVDIE